MRESEKIEPVGIFLKPGITQYSRILFLDLFKGSRILQHYNSYRGMLTWDKEKLNAYRFDRLKTLIQYSFDNIDFYRESLKKADITPADIQSIDDLVHLPVIDRKSFQLYYSSFKNQNFKKKKIISGSSSGSTGIPLHYETDISGYSAGIACRFILNSLSGYKPGYKTYYIWGNKYSVQHWKTPMSRLRQAVFRQKNVASTDINECRDMEFYVKDILRFNPFAIEGYTNSIHHLAIAFKESGTPPPKSLKVVFTTAENLDHSARGIIEGFLGPVSDQYGCSEINGIAVQPIHENKYFIFEPHVVVECLKEKPSDAMGEIAVTDLDNFHMPLIRYMPGDLISEVNPPVKDDLVPFSSFNRIYGRSSEHIILSDGRKIFPVTIFGGTAFRKIPEITRHKVIWDGQKLTMLFETSGRVDMETLDTIIKGILEAYHLPYELKIVDRIQPDPGTGKFKYFSNISQIS